MAGYRGITIDGVAGDKVRWRNVDVGSQSVCAVPMDSNKPVCWGPKKGNERVLAVPTKGIIWDQEKSCLIQHPELGGATSCTMCHKGCHHTITDPKRNAGMCTKELCPMCKPKSCCGKNHKHYVVNTESMEGVCVRHNDDCTAVCVPQKPDPHKKQVCTKGCNRMLKVAKTKPAEGASTDKSLFDILVCQVDHRIVCDAWKPCLGNGRKSCTPCKTTKWVRPVARCLGFDASVWNEGATCIANAAQQAPTKPTPARLVATVAPKAILGCRSKVGSTTEAKVKTCKVATEADKEACVSFATPIAEYY